MFFKNLFLEHGLLNGKRTLVFTLATILIFSTSITVFAITDPEIKSYGKVIYESENGEVKIDSDDFQILVAGLKECNDEVDTIYSALNNAFEEEILPGNSDLSVEDIINSKVKDITVKPNGLTNDTTNVNSVLPAIVQNISIDSSVPEEAIYTDDELNVHKCSSAIASNLTKGAAAWVDGNLIIGTGADNEMWYEKGRIDGYNEGIDALDVIYAYHEHTGSAEDGSGCYTKPILHEHTNACYGSCGGTADRVAWIDNGWHATMKCRICGYSWTDTGDRAQYSSPATSTCRNKVLKCSLGNSIVGWELGCNKTTETVESATIIFK